MAISVAFPQVELSFLSKLSSSVRARSKIARTLRSAPSREIRGRLQRAKRPPIHGKNAAPKGAQLCAHQLEHPRYIEHHLQRYGLDNVVNYI